MFSLFWRKPKVDRLKSLPHQLVKDLPMMPEIEEMMQVVRSRKPKPNRRALARAEEDFKYQYYYGGQHTAVTRMPEGLAVLATGEVAIWRLQDFLTDEERRRVTLVTIEAWLHNDPAESEVHETENSPRPAESHPIYD